MNDRELKQLQHNLTKSAKKAKKYWVRGMVGYTESDQGFFPIEDVPVKNRFKNKETILSEYMEDVDYFVKKMELTMDGLNNKFNKMITSHEEAQERINKLEAEVAKLQQEIIDLVTFNLG